MATKRKKSSKLQTEYRKQRRRVQSLIASYRRKGYDVQFELLQKIYQGKYLKEKSTKKERKSIMMIELIGKNTVFTAWLNETNNHVTIYNQYYDPIDEGILIADEVITTKLGVLTFCQ